MYCSCRLLLRYNAMKKRDYTKDEKEMSMYTLKRASQVPIIAPGATDEESCGDVRMQGKGSIYNCSNSWSEFSPKIGIDYQVNDDVMTYFHVSKGFRSGVFNARPLAPNEVSSAEPETLTSYEFGFKSQWYDNRFQLIFFGLCLSTRRNSTL